MEKHLSRGNVCLSIRLLLLMLAIVLVGCTLFVITPELEDSMTVGKVFWLHLSTLLLAGCAAVAFLWEHHLKYFYFSIADGLFLAFAGIVLLTYDWELNPAPEKLLFGGQLLVLWFLLRLMLNQWHQLCEYILLVLVVTGLVESVWGVLQLYGVVASNHGIFRLTGSFYNPGPYSGYLALVLPMCLWKVLSYDRKNTSRLLVNKIIYYMMCGIALMILIVLPAGMSRTAWIASIIACGWVYWYKYGAMQVKALLEKYRIKPIVFFIGLLFIIIMFAFGLFVLKKDSALGRLLLWKVTGKAIMEQPFTGVGLGGFPVAYAEAQAKYFSSGKASGPEIWVADCPDYAFNEFLQIGLEQGIIGLLLFMLLLCYSIASGIRAKQIGVVGSLLALMIFSLASYPLQLPELWVVLVFLLAVSNNDAGKFRYVRKRSAVLLIIGGLGLSAYGFCSHGLQYYPAYKEWRYVKQLHNAGIDDSVIDAYTNLTLQLPHRPELLFETALCFNGEKRYEQATHWLYRAMKLSNNPMIYYVTAQNEQLMGNYHHAERLLLHSIQMLPERIYPYYLLTQLYSDSLFFQKDKYCKVAKYVLEHRPKVESPAIQEMRKKVQEHVTKLKLQIE